ncbi:hypothetical protein U1Q18_003570, partial [Sarracenia purpurea var. burkii]
YTSAMYHRYNRCNSDMHQISMKWLLNQATFIRRKTLLQWQDSFSSNHYSFRQNKRNSACAKYNHDDDNEEIKRISVQ